jgi:hypothetical protein
MSYGWVISRPKALRKTKLESANGGSFLSCEVTDTPKSSAFLRSVDLHARLSGHISQLRIRMILKSIIRIT